MNQTQFLNTLRNRLSTSLKESEIDLIVEFYTRRFNDGLAQGKSEEELIAEFGKPKNIANTLLPPKFKPITRSSYIYIALFLVGIFPLIEHVFQIYVKIGYSPTYTFFSYSYAAIAPILLCLLRQQIKEKHFIIPIRRKNICLAFQVGSIIAVILTLFVFWGLVTYMMDIPIRLTLLDPISRFILHALLGNQMEFVAPLMRPFLLLSVLLLVAVWFIALFYEKDSVNILSMGAFFASGLLQTVCFFRSLMFSLTNVEAFVVQFPRCWIPFAISAIVGILFFLGSYMLPKINTKRHSPILSIQ